MKLQTKIALSLGPFVLLVLTAIFLFNYTLIHRILTENALQDLRKTEKNMYRAVQTQLSTAINNYLRGIAESNLAYVQSRYQEFQQGRLSEQEAKEAIQKHFNEQQVGSSGYPVAVLRQNEKLYLELHPYLKGQECTETEGCRQWANVANGYTEYDWKNPADNSYRKKAAFVRQFKPWNWVIGASSYRDEFVDLINVTDLEKLLAPVRINRSGYFAVFDDKGQLLFHPELYNTRNHQLLQEQAKAIFEKLKLSKNGYLTYNWKNPSDQKNRQKYAFIEHLKEFNWYLVATGYLSEIDEPFQSLPNITLAMIIMAGLVLFFLIFRLSRNLTRPLLQLEQGIKAFDEEKIQFQWHPHKVEEINILGDAFARMTGQLTRTINDLQTSNRQLALSEQETRESRALLESTIDSMPSIIIGVDAQLLVTQWNNTAERLTGRSRGQVQLRPLVDVYPEMQHYIEDLTHSLNINKTCVIPSSFQEGKGRTQYREITIFPLLSHGLRGAVLRIDDTTERVEMEQRLRQSQKMDAIGHLAGGMAHDFNNMLGGILGAADALRLRIGAEELPLINNIRIAAERSGELIRNLLAFARKEHIALGPVNVAQIVIESVEILKRTLDKKITITHDLAPQPTLVMGDKGQLQSALLNLGINAGYAMPDGGKLSFTTKIGHFDQAYCDLSSFSLTPGTYLQLEVRDTGTGIAPEHLRQIFEPFFTTKKGEQGNGLGLAAVYGTVQQHQGEILVKSTLGLGTIFSLHLPLFAGEEAKEVPVAPEAILGQGNILLIDDEPVIRLAVRFMLEGLGYTVCEADNGHTGVEYYKQHQHEIDLVLLDMVMPVMDGNECFRQLKAFDPRVRVVIASGFTRDADFSSLSQEGLTDFIRKPYTLQQLSELLHRLLHVGAAD
ncbi:MAG: cache domain-containing protein [Desulfobulbus sp.]|nr:cache domain-containing protein [Desulfobulbus sp.]